jgi:uncharacterized protein YbjT (DUF2867 family)
MSSNEVVVVIGATGQQGSGVVKALKTRGRFRVRALTRDPSKYRGPADEVVAADLGERASLVEAFRGARGVFAVTNFWEKGADEVAQGTNAVEAAKTAGVEHFVWSTLPDVDGISGGSLHVPHFTSKAKVDAIVAAAGFRHSTFVEAPFYFQNLTGMMAPRPLDGGRSGWVLPLPANARVVHMGDISELGNLVAGALERPEASDGRHLSLAGGLLSFDDVVATLRALGHDVVYQQVPYDVFGTSFPGAEEMAAMCKWFERYTYFGPEAETKLARAREVTVAPFTSFPAWAEVNMKAP